MRIVKLAAGLATGYVLGARAGREKFDQITAVAGKLTGRPVTAPAERSEPQAEAVTAPAVVPSAEQPAPVAEAVTAPAVVPSAEQPAPVAAGAKPRRPRNRRPKTVAETATSASGGTTATGTADLGLDALPMDAAEADVVEQHMLVVDNTEESALTPPPLESDAVDAREQRRSV